MENETALKFNNDKGCKQRYFCGKNSQYDFAWATMLGVSAV